MKARMFSLFLGSVLCLAVGCGMPETAGAPSAAPESADGSSVSIAEEPRGQEENAPDEAYKIGILTGSQLLYEEEFRVAARMSAIYGDLVKTSVYPDLAPGDVSVVTSSAISLAADPQVKVIVMMRPSSGAVEAVKRVHALRDDILFICTAVPGDPEAIASVADLVLQADYAFMGDWIVRQAAELGAVALIHYGYPRNLESALSAARHDLIQESCELEGIQFVEVETPDPAGDYGPAGTIRFLEADIPERLEWYGPDIALFGVDPIMQEPLIRGALEGGAIFPSQSDLSSSLGYSGALGFQIPDERLTDTNDILNRIYERLRIWLESGEDGSDSLTEDEAYRGYRLSAWDINGTALMLEAGVRYGIEHCEGRLDGFDEDALRRIISETALEYGGTAAVTAYEEEGKKLDRFFLIRGEAVTFPSPEGED